MADEITTDTQNEATETPVSSSPIESIQKQTETTDSTDSVVSVLPEEIPIEPANSPLENPIEENSEIQSENIKIEPIPEIIEQKQENIQNTEIEKTESTIQAEIKIPDVPIQGENDKTEIKEPNIKKEEEKRETIKSEPSIPVFVPTPSVVLSSFEKNMKRARELLVKARATIQSYENLLSQDAEKQGRDLEIYIPPGPRLGDVVIECKDVSKGYGDRLLVENVSFLLPPGATVGIIGPNGAGKTTLFRMITGQEQPDSGTIRLGDTVKLAYVDQSRDVLDPDKSIWEMISEGYDVIKLGTREVNSRAYVSKFNFSGTDQQKKVGLLSGGERNRVHMARMMKEEANVLLLDEPTNDLDVNTMRALEEALENFAGCVLVISHDRWFLDRIATHILAFEGESEVYFYDGNYTEYEEHKKQRLGAAASDPHRIKYRQLTRS